MNDFEVRHVARAKFVNSIVDNLLEQGYSATYTSGTYDIYLHLNEGELVANGTWNTQFGHFTGSILTKPGNFWEHYTDAEKFLRRVGINIKDIEEQ